MKKRFLWLSTAFIFASVAHAQVMTSPPSYSENQTNKLDIYRAEAERINNLVHTKLDLKFDYQKEEVHGEEWVTLKPHFYAMSTFRSEVEQYVSQCSNPIRCRHNVDPYV